ncbi:ZIP family metal transporter [Candidatus Uhrbacteria bacterium]|nr:ZIP family metal transporter [Candidatus Uhrbacteria bacterium]
MTFIFIIVSTILISLLSFVGVLVVTFTRLRLQNGILILVALSAGAMFGNAVFHLLPETVELSKTGPFSLFTSLLILTFAFVLSFQFEQWFSWHHCHNKDHCEPRHPWGHLILLSDFVHNFVDGIIIATAFILSPSIGVFTTVAIALHEIPQELGDYAVLIHSGWSKRQAVWSNFAVSLTAIAGGTVGYFLTQSFSFAVPFLVPFAAGSFLYIATSDLIPELKHQTKAKEISLQSFIFVSALVFMILATLLE